MKAETSDQDEFLNGITIPILMGIAAWKIDETCESQGNRTREGIKHKKGQGYKNII